ncbi:hypothetical protein KAU11_06580, partial [Candidatus Babeliales bacterium]|nr:hypothetical protein [Candidatus Babeliales bacterium]
MEAEAKIAILESKVAALQEELTVARKVAQEEHGKASRATRTLGRKENGDRQLIAELIAFLDYVGIQELIDKRDL